MKYKIISIRRRNFLIRALSVYHWKVAVKIDDGRILSVNAYAGCDFPDSKTLIGDVEDTLNKILKPEPKRIPRWMEVLDAVGKSGEIKLGGDAR